MISAECTALSPNTGLKGWHPVQGPFTHVKKDWLLFNERQDIRLFCFVYFFSVRGQAINRGEETPHATTPNVNSNKVRVLLSSPKIFYWLATKIG